LRLEEQKCFFNPWISFSATLGTFHGLAFFYKANGFRRSAFALNTSLFTFWCVFGYAIHYLKDMDDIFIERAHQRELIVPRYSKSY
jgi:hypothetical protein